MLTDRPGFYINFPCGAITLATTVLFFTSPSNSNHKLPLKQKVASLDLQGWALPRLGIIMLLLALQ